MQEVYLFLLYKNSYFIRSKKCWKLNKCVVDHNVLKQISTQQSQNSLNGIHNYWVISYQFSVKN